MGKKIYIAGMCILILAGMSGCSSNVKSESESKDDKAAEESTIDADDTEMAEETDTDADLESAKTDEEFSSDLLCVYGPVSEVAEDSVTIDNQSGFGSLGEMIITFSANTPIFDAETGDPTDMTEVKNGEVVYAYIGNAMTMSEPPITNGELFFIHSDNVSEMPVYTEIDSVEKEDDSSENTVIKTKNGSEYTISEETRILPYLTRNIVTAEDLESGKKCVIWADSDGKVLKMILFQ